MLEMEYAIHRWSSGEDGREELELGPPLAHKCRIQQPGEEGVEMVVWWVCNPSLHSACAICECNKEINGRGESYDTGKEG